MARKLMQTGEERQVNNSAPALQNAKLGSRVKEMLDIGQAFIKTVSLTSAAAGTAVSIITDAEVGDDRKIYITSMLLNVSGATAWTDTTATKVSVKDTSSSPVEAIAIAKAGLTGNANLNLLTANVTLATNLTQGTGLTLGKGLNFVGDAVFAAGSTIYLTVIGIIK